MCIGGIWEGGGGCMGVMRGERGWGDSVWGGVGLEEGCRYVSVGEYGERGWKGVCESGIA